MNRSNPFEHMARLHKANALIAAIDTVDPRVTSAHVRRFKEETWTLLARVAGVPLPSVRTREVVANMLAERERLTRGATILPFVAAGSDPPKDSNPSGFTAHRETGNPSAVESSDVHRSDGFRMVQRTGQGGETLDVFARSKHSKSRRAACTPGSVRW